ncbi:MAG: hypothetical protein Q4G05_03760 [Clostridia bacterium]|nr:hypothetical protein [Clostridia bacterium]
MKKNRNIIEVTKRLPRSIKAGETVRIGENLWTFAIDAAPDDTSIIRVLKPSIRKYKNKDYKKENSQGAKRLVEYLNTIVENHMEARNLTKDLKYLKVLDLEGLVGCEDNAIKEICSFNKETFYLATAVNNREMYILQNGVLKTTGSNILESKVLFSAWVELDDLEFDPSRNQWIFRKGLAETN